MKAFFFRITALFLSLCLTLFFLEAALALVRYEPPRYVTLDDYKDINKLYGPHGNGIWSGNLGAVMEFKVRIENNSLGLHDVEHSFPKPENTYRILCVGDSFVEAWQVPLDKAFFRILEASLNKHRDRFEGKTVEVIAMGGSGQGALAQLQNLTQTGFRFNPDHVFVFLTDQNDFNDDLSFYRSATQPQPKPDLKTRLAAAMPNAKLVAELKRYEDFILFSGSRLNKWLAFKMVEWRRAGEVKAGYRERFQNDLGVFFKDYETLPESKRKDWTEAFRLTTLAHLNMHKRSRDRGVRFTTVFVDNVFRYDKRRRDSLYKLLPEFRNNLDFDAPVRKMKRIFDAQGIEHLDLTEAFASVSQSGRNPLHYPLDGHWNTDGHALAARVLESYLLNDSR